jgi:hypothetical protein
MENKNSPSLEGLVIDNELLAVLYLTLRDVYRGASCHVLSAPDLLPVSTLMLQPKISFHINIILWREYGIKSRQFSVELAMKIVGYFATEPR